MIKGQNLVGGVWQNNAKASIFHTVNPKTTNPLETAFQEATDKQIQESVIKAISVFDRYASTTFKQRIQFLQAILAELQAVRPNLLKTYQLESALPTGRAEGEFQRTLGQIQQFIKLLEEGTFVQPIIHTAGTDLRKMLYPIGPVAVFGASNFPLAFSTAGGDTISAFAAGCPVIVKAHPYHAGTSALVAQAIHNAIKLCSLPVEIFSHLGGASHRVGQQLVLHPQLKAVGFTGSFIGGKSLYDLVQSREEPIPVFAEMGSINPIFITEKRLATDEKLAENLAQSISLGTGQFCTNPGMIVFCDPNKKSEITLNVIEYLSKINLVPMVHSKIEKQFKNQINKLHSKGVVNLVAASENIAAVGIVSAVDLKTNKSLTDEVFGPFSLFVQCDSLEEMHQVADLLSGQLTATLLSCKEEYADLNSLVMKLKRKVGRLLFEGVPTGVAVTQAMQHGGPYPASTDGRFTSVGTDAIYRWLRPIAFQDCPDELLPLALQNSNPLGLQRKLDGQYTEEAI